MTNEKIRFAQRLIDAMQAQGYDPEPAILEREFNLRHFGEPVTLQGVRKWLIGTAIPSADKLLTLAKWLNVPPEELAFDKDMQKAIEMLKKKEIETINDVCEHFEISSENLIETETILAPIDNEDYSTLEVWKDGDVIYQNGK